MTSSNFPPIWRPFAGILVATVMVGLPFGSLGATNVPNYGVFELTLTATGRYRDPYLLMPGDNTTPGFVVGTFTGPSGQKITIDGFWAGGQGWKVRMAPTDVGTWTYTTRSADGGLNGHRGTFVSMPSSSKGFIRVNPARPHQFMWTDGTPFLMKPVSMSVHATNAPNTLRGKRGWFADFQFNVDTRVAQGFNAMNWGMVLAKWALDRGGTVQRNEGGNVFARTMDMNNPLNPGYFDAADRRVEYALSKGMVPQFGLVWPDTLPRGWTIERGKRLWRYVIARYAAYNVTWNIFGEGNEWKSDAVLNDWGALTKAADPYGHPTSFHQSNWSGVETQDWMDFLIFEWSARRDNPNKRVVIDHKWSIGKPIVYAEFQAYDDAPPPYGASPERIRKLFWKLWAAGAYPVYETWGQSCRGRACLNTEATAYIENMWSFVERTNWTELEPSQSVVNNGDCMARPGREYVIYLETGGAVSVDLSVVAESASVQWYNPRTGAVSVQTNTMGGGTRTFTAPSNDDWVLHIVVPR